MNTHATDPGRLGRWPGTTSTPHRRALLASDVLPLLDFLGLLLALWIATSLHSHLQGGLQLARPLMRAALLAAALGPFLLYDGRFGGLASRAAWRPLLQSQARRFAGCAAGMLGLAAVSPELAAAPHHWMAPWMSLSVGVILLNRAWLARQVRTTAGISTRLAGDDAAAPALPVWLLADRPIKQWDAVLKSAEDLVLGSLLTVLLLPVLALTALAIRIDSPGPVLFRQRRHTLDNREFDILKFRTMHWRAGGTDTELRQTARNDARVTRVGNWLRKSSLDELPQLFNVLRGEMSLVGPRPHAVNMRTENRLGPEITAVYAHRHRIRPGITGWAQVNGARGATDTVAQLRRRVELDLYYIDQWSLWLDLKILALTAREVLKRTNAY